MAKPSISFFEAFSAIMYKLSIPTSELELIEILARNLRPHVIIQIAQSVIQEIIHLKKSN